MLVKLTASEVPPHYQLGECPLDRFVADLNPLLSLQLLLDLAGFEPCVGDAVAELAAFALTDDTEPAFDDTQAQRCDRAKPLLACGGHLNGEVRGGCVEPVGALTSAERRPLEVTAPEPLSRW